MSHKSGILKTIYLIYLVIFISSCSIYQRTDIKNINGKYSRSLVYGVYQELIFHTDQTFEFNWTGGLDHGTTKGTWKYINRILILNSYKQPVKYENILNHITFEEEDSIGIYQIKIIDSLSQEPIIYANCYVSNETKITSSSISDFDGECRLKYAPNNDTLKISHLGYNEIEIPINELISKKITLNLIEREPFYWYFTNEELKVSQEGIIDSRERKIGKIYFQKHKK